jgi:hypothetical protein
MRVSHGVEAVFDDPNLVSCAGLVPVLALAGRAGLQELVAEHVRIDKTGGANAQLKVSSLGGLAAEALAAATQSEDAPTESASERPVLQMAMDGPGREAQVLTNLVE